jgi:nucleotide-binding universal stress UspA family protein
MKTILVPTDFSKTALNAIKYALAYAENTRSKVILFNSFDNPTGELDIPFTDTHIGKQEAKQAAENRMNKLVTSLSKKFPKSKPKWVVQPGVASNNIGEYVRQNKISLVIMGTTGQGAIARKLIGSTTSSVITNTPCTIIAVPPKAKFKGINKIAIATDLEKDSFLAANESVSFAKQHHAEITFVHVQDLEIFDSETALQEMVDKTKKQMKYKNISFYLCRDSDVADGLDTYIKKNKPDVLSMVTYGRKFPETIWKASWTDKMSNYISVPLLVLHVSKVKTDTETSKEKKVYSLGIV